MKKVLLLITAAALMAGCINRRAAVPETERDYITPQDVTDLPENDIIRAADEHTAQNSLDFAGTYKGVIPCADCSGIETVLTLNQDGTYELTSKYLEKNDNVYTSEGTYRWESDGTRIILDGGDAHGNRYFVAEGRVFMLDRDGNRIEGSLADHYILTKE